MTARNRWRTALLCVAALGVAIGLGACGGSDDTGPAETEGAGTTGGAMTQQAAGDPRAGEGIFAANCAGCHGATGTGGSGGPNLSQSAIAGDVVKVIAQVTNGGGGMPAFGDELDAQQIRDVSAYVAETIHGGP